MKSKQTRTIPLLLWYIVSEGLTLTFVVWVAGLRFITNHQLNFGLGMGQIFFNNFWNSSSHTSSILYYISAKQCSQPWCSSERGPRTELCEENSESVCENSKKTDKSFMMSVSSKHGIVLAMCLVLLPSVANRTEFTSDFLLSLADATQLNV